MINLIDRKILFGNPERINVRLSPDGKYIAYIAPFKNVLNIWVAPVGNLEKAYAITNDKKRGVQTYSWAFDNKTLLYVKDMEGNENWQVFAVSIENQKHYCLTPQNNIQARIEKLSPLFTQELLISINDRNPAYHDLYRINISTCERTLIFTNEGYSGYVCDEQLQLRMLMSETPEGGSTWFHLNQNELIEFQNIPAEDRLTTAPLMFNKDGSKLYTLDSRARNTGALYEFDISQGIKQVIGEDALTDISDIMLNPLTREIDAYATTYERKKWHFIKENIASDISHFQRNDDADVEIVSRTLDDQQWIVALIRDNGPVSYYHYDRSSKAKSFLFTNRSTLENVPLVRMKSVVVKARDDLDLLCYLSLPEDNDSPLTLLPLVLLVHGGPSARDNWGYEPISQWLANRGYAVLSVNYRGSTGFGKNFLNAGNGEWGRKMHNDLIDAVQWSIDQKIADPKRIAIMGGSYGGYATLVGLTFTPDTFACGIDIVGPSNLVTLVESIPPYWKPYLSALKVTMGADFDTEEGKEFLRQRSPINYVDTIKKPLLICQGANDPRVKQAESDQIVRAMRERDIPVTYVLYPDEGHGLTRPANRLSFFGIAESFLAQHLGGRKQPLSNNDFMDSSFQIMTGKEAIHDLEIFNKESKQDNGHD